MSDKDTMASFGLGLLIGAAIGTAIGMLYAPQSGKETRELIREKAIETREKAEDIIEDARERAKKIVADAKTKADELTNKQQPRYPNHLQRRMADGITCCPPFCSPNSGAPPESPRCLPDCPPPVCISTRLLLS